MPDLGFLDVLTRLQEIYLPRRMTGFGSLTGWGLAWLLWCLGSDEGLGDEGDSVWLGTIV